MSLIFISIPLLVSFLFARNIVCFFLFAVFMTTLGIQLAYGLLFEDQQQPSLYVFFMLTGLFFIPIVILNFAHRCFDKRAWQSPHLHFNINFEHQNSVIFALAYVVIIAFGLFTLYANNILYLRIGYSELAYLYLQFNFVERLAVKFLEDVSAPIMVIIFFVAKDIKSRKLRLITWFVWTMNLLFLAMNSRYDFLCLVVVLALFTGNLSLKNLANKRVLLIAFSAFFLTILRPLFEFLIWGRENAFEIFFRLSQWTDRLNGYEDLELIYSKASLVGYMHGGAWAQFNLPFLYIFEREAYIEQKLSALLGAKVLIWEHFSGEIRQDYVSSIVSDWIANFGFLSLPIYAIIIFSILSYSTNFNVKSRFSQAIKLFILYKLLHVDANFFNLMISWKELVIYILFLIPLFMQIPRHGFVAIVRK